MLKTRQVAADSVEAAIISTEKDQVWVNLVVRDLLETSWEHWVDCELEDDRNLEPSLLLLAIFHNLSVPGKGSKCISLPSPLVMGTRRSFGFFHNTVL